MHLERWISWLTSVLTVLIFIVPAAYLVQIWSRKAPPALSEINRAHVEASDGVYSVTLPSGARYQLARSDVNGSAKRRAALEVVRSRLTSENASYNRSWARFWFLLAGACGVAMLLTFLNRTIQDALSKAG